MNPFDNESTFFTYWLSIQNQPSILPNQTSSVALILSRLHPADLISVLYHGDDKTSLKALKELRKRFTEELHLLNEQLMMQAMQDDQTSWH